jgi:hypothetical protein
METTRQLINNNLKNIMQKTKRAILASIALIAMVAMAMPVFAASGGGDLPGENEPFWTIFSQIAKPTDTSACVAYATMYVNSQNFSNEQKQGEIAGYTQMCNEIASMPAEMQSEMAAEGVTSNLFAAPNWHLVSGLYFEKSGMGKIEFTNTIDFMSYRFMNFMTNFQNMVQFSDGYISLNASTVTDMKYYGAQLTMYGLNFSEIPDIYVTDPNGTTMHKATDSDISAVTYNPDTGELTFNTSHFSAFKAVTKGSKVTAMKITKVTPNKIKYSAKKRSFKITVKGRGFYKKSTNTSCMMGTEQAQKVKASKNGKKVVCTFEMSSFSTLGLYPVSITVAGTGQMTKANAVRMR